MNRLTLMGLLALLTPMGGSGQALPTLTPGAGVRVHDLEGRENVGTLRAPGPDGIVLLDEPGDPTSRQVFDAPSISRLELLVGQHREVLKTLAVVSSVTGVSVAVIAATNYQPCSPDPYPLFGEIACAAVPSSRGEEAVYGFVAGAVLGIPIGLVIGLLNDHDTWSQVFPGGAGEAVGLNLRLSPGSDGGIRAAGTIPLGRAR